MKKYVYLFLFTVAAYTAQAQTVTDSKYGDFVYVTQKRDTIFLDERSTMSKLTASAWYADSTWKGVNPTLVFVPTETILSLKKNDEPSLYARKRNTPRKTRRIRIK